MYPYHTGSRVHDSLSLLREKTVWREVRGRDSDDSLTMILLSGQASNRRKGATVSARSGALSLASINGWHPALPCHFLPCNKEASPFLSPFPWLASAAQGCSRVDLSFKSRAAGCSRILLPAILVDIVSRGRMPLFRLCSPYRSSNASLETSTILFQSVHCLQDRRLSHETKCADLAIGIWTVKFAEPRIDAV